MSNKIKIVVVLDESGSMQTLLGSTRESFDGFINSQQQLDGDASIHTSVTSYRYTHAQKRMA